MIASRWFRLVGKRWLASAVRPGRNPLALQTLEDRTTPAGNVTAFVGDGILYVVGDDAANQVSVAGTGRRSAIVRPLGDTTLNGGDGGVALGGIRGYHVQLLGGDDTVVVSGVDARRSLTVNTDDGNDTVSLLDVRSRRDTRISTGAGNDDVLIANSRLRRRTAVDTGTGDDAVSVVATRFGRDTYFSGGTGTDSLGAFENHFRRDPHVSGFERTFDTLLPRAADDRASVAAGAAVVIPVAANDVARAGTLDLSSVIVTAQPAFGSVTANADGSVTYTAGGTASGPDTFRYTIRNSGGAVSNEATVTVSVAGAAISPPTPPPAVPPIPPVTPPADTVAPTVALSSPAADPTNASPIPFRATFDEDVTGLGAGGITVANGLVVGFTAVDARTYTFEVEPSGQGIVTATVAAGAARDAAGNANAASNAVSVTFDTLAPAVTASPLTSNDTTPTLTGTVDDPAAAVTVTVGGQTVAAVVSGTTFTATLPTPLAEGAYTVEVSATDRAGNTAATSLPNGLVIDTTAPAAAVASTAPDPTNTSPIPFTVTFSEDVTGFSAAGLVVTNGTVVNFTAVDARTYTFGVSPTGNGTVSVSVMGGAAFDAAGNGSTVSAAVTRTFSTGAVVVSADRLTTNDTTPTLTGTVGDPAATVRVMAGGQTVTATVSGTSYSATLPVPLAEGTYDIQVTATDAANNVGTTTQTGGLVIDLTVPTATVATTVPSPTNLAGIPFTVTFSEPVTGFTAGGLTVTNGTAAGFTQVDARNYTFAVAPTGDGPVGVSVAAAAATDAAGNTNPPSAAATVTSDRTAPTPAVSSTADDPTGTNPIPFTVTFTEAVTEFVAADVTVGNGSVTGFTAVDGRTYTFNVVPAAAGVVSVSVAAGRANDLAGNASRASNTLTRQFTGAVVTPTVSTAAASPTNLAPIAFAVTFDGDVTGFELADLAVTNGTAANFVAVNARTYTFDVTPTADGTVTVAVPAGAATGADGAPTAAGSFSIVSDRPAPVTALTTTAADPTNLGVIPFILTFTEDVTGVTAGDLTASNGTVSNFTPVDARTYTFDVTPDTDGPVGVSVAAAAGQDAAGNASTATSFTVTSDRAAPTVAVTTTEADPTAASPIPFTATFSEAVNGFSAAGVMVTNGTVSNFVAVDASTYTFDVAPDGDGPVAVTVNAGAAADAAGNANTAGSLTITSERFAPTAVISSAATDPTNLAAIPVTVTFSEDITGFDETDLGVANGSVSNFVAVGPRVFTFDVTPAADGLVTVDLPAGAAQDTAGNPSVAATFSVTSDRTAPDAPVVVGLAPASDSGTPGDGLTNVAAPTLVGAAEAGATVEVFVDSGSGPLSLGTVVADAGGNWTLTPAAPLADGTYAVTATATDPAGNTSPVSATFTLIIDTVAPAVALTTTAADPTNLAAIPFTVSFDVDVTGFDETDLTVANGMVSNFAAVDARTFTFDVTPAVDGAVSVTVAAGVATDAAGNSSAAVTRSVVSDRTAPIGSVTAVSSTAADPIVFTVTFDEDVGDLDPTALTVTNGTLGTLTRVDARTFTVEVTPAADGPVTLTVAANATTDAAGNANVEFAGTATSDRTAPTAALTTTATDPTNAATLSFTVTFSENVTGFDLANVQVTNGTASGLVAVDGRTCTFDVTPTADGPVSVTVPAGVAADAAGNVNTASATVTVTSDRTPPTATIDPAPTAAITGTAADATTGVAGVAVSIFDGTAYWDGTAFTSPTEVFLAASSADGFASWSYAFPVPGTYTVRARATDLAGNESFTSAGVTVG